MYPARPSLICVHAPPADVCSTVSMEAKQYPCQYELNKTDSNSIRKTSQAAYKKKENKENESMKRPTFGYSTFASYHAIVRLLPGHINFLSTDLISRGHAI